jgi:NAD(P)H-flavin reductase
MLFIGACWGHWEQLKCFLLPSLLLWFVDRGACIARTLLSHYNVLPETGKLGFSPAKALISLFPDSQSGDVVRLDFQQQTGWEVGQHFFLCFLDGSVWQSHPFTPLSLPKVSGKSGSVTHSYVFRAKSGETKKIAEVAALKQQAATPDVDIGTRVVLTGPYGVSIVDDLASTSNVLCIAGGTGITYVLPVLLHLIENDDAAHRNVELVWVVRKAENVEWVAKELERLRTRSSITIMIFVTRDTQQIPPLDHKECDSDEKLQSSRSSSDDGEKTSTPALLSSAEGRPDLPLLLHNFIENNVRGPTTVFASGPAQMTSELRTAVAASNAGSKVWKGDERYNVRLVCDDRSEWCAESKIDRNRFLFARNM